MKDQSMNVLLMVLFGLSGIAILMLAWLQPMPVADRIIATVIGSSGLLVAPVRAWRLKFSPAKMGSERAADIAAEDNS